MHATPIANAAALVALCTVAFTAQAQGEIDLAPADDCVSCAPSRTRAAPPPTTPQSLPATPLAPVAFRLNGIRLSGAQALPAGELNALTAPYVGRNVTLPELETLAQQIGEKYRARGYFLAQAVVPVQTVQGGIVEISVIEGRLGRLTVNVAPEAPITEARVRAFLASLQPGQALSGPAYERAMLLLSDQPGIAVKSSLEEGAQPGATDLTVDVAAAPKWAFSLDADNHGTKETGRYRAGGNARWMSPFGIGDNLDARLMASNNGELAFGRVSYEAPIGASGLRAGMGLSHINYELGGEFANLDVHGTADIVDASLSYPLIRSRQQNLSVRLGADLKNLRDNYRAVDYASRKRVNGVGLGWVWERRDTLLGGGYTASSGVWYHGRLDIRDALNSQADQSSSGNHTQGSFDKLSFQVSRLQRVVQNHALHLSIGGQLAGKNLDASEKISLGGAQAVRAYPLGEVLADQGLTGSIEWRWSVNPQWTIYPFYDAARGWRSKNSPLADPDNLHSLRGVGIGVQWARPNDFSINATLAWRDGTPPAVTDGGNHHSPGLYLQFQKVFR